MIGWLLALLVWVGCWLVVSWRLQDNLVLYVAVMAAMVGTSIPLVRGIVAEVRRPGDPS